ncbi:MAG: xanthine dehydrogenase family protein subunit M [Halobacteriales archaeon]|nr:xanthine dehydrogenase family protein subunit M [Halobacteriales archaeon]
MYPGRFDYVEATSVEEALDLLAEHADAETELLAGGHSLIPTMKSGLASPDVLIDLGGVDDLRGIEHGDGVTTIGAMTPYADIVDDAALREASTAFAEATAAVGDIQVRNRGTVGGNLAHADPASDLPGAALAADATVVVQGRDGERSVPAEEFFVGMYTTDVGEDELVTRVELPHQPAGAGGAYVKKPSPSSGYAMVGVAATVEADGGEITAARVAANGALDHASRLEPVESALVGEPLDPDVAEAAGGHATDDVEEWQLLDDLQASGEFRGHLLEVFAARAIDAAIERAG